MMKGYQTIHNAPHHAPHHRQVAHALDDQDPPAQRSGMGDDGSGSGGGSSDEGGGMEVEGAEGEAAAAEEQRARVGGGLHTLFTMVMAGLAGQTPHMIRCVRGWYSWCGCRGDCLHKEARGWLPRSWCLLACRLGARVRGAHAPQRL